jgi:hypothetical protein
MAEELFRHHLLRLLKAKGLLSDERIALLRSWKSTGFNADDSVRIPAGERRTLEHVARYMLRSPVSLSRMQWTPGSSHVFYAPKSSHDEPSQLFPPLEKIDALEFLARVITQIPEPRRHLLFYYGHYANVVRGRHQSAPASEPSHFSPNETEELEPTPSPPSKQALRRSLEKSSNISITRPTPAVHLHIPRRSHPPDPTLPSPRRYSCASLSFLDSSINTRRHPSLLHGSILAP